MKFLLSISNPLCLHAGPLPQDFIVNLFLGSFLAVDFPPFLTKWKARVFSLFLPAEDIVTQNECLLNVLMTAL